MHSKRLSTAISERTTGRPISSGRREFNTYMLCTTPPVESRCSVQYLFLSACIFRSFSPIFDALFADFNEAHHNTERIVEETMIVGNRDFTVQGQRKDHNTIFLRLQIVDSSGSFFNVSHILLLTEDGSEEYNQSYDL